MCLLQQWTDHVTRQVGFNLHVLTKVPQKFEIPFVPLQIDKKKKAWYRNLSIHSMILVQVGHLYIHWTSGDPPQFEALREMLIIIFPFLIFHFQCWTFAPRKRINQAWLRKSLGMLQGVASHQVPRSGILSISSPKNTIWWILCQSLSTIWHKIWQQICSFLVPPSTNMIHFQLTTCRLFVFCCWQLRLRLKGFLTLTVILMSCQSCSLTLQVWPTPGTKSPLACSEAYRVHWIEVACPT